MSTCDGAREQDLKMTYDSRYCFSSELMELLPWQKSYALAHGGDLGPGTVLGPQAPLSLARLLDPQ
jgi:hypothetical protein